MEKISILNILKKDLIRKNNIYFDGIIDYLIYYCFLFFSLVDCITGLFLQMGLPSIGVPFKILLMLLLFIGAKSEKKFILLLYLIVLFLCCANVYLNQSYTNFSTSLSMILKIMMYPFVLFYISDTYSRKKNGCMYLKNICHFNFLTILVNQIIGILGYGFSTYSDGGFGIKGFYYDGNAMAVVCFCLFVFFLSIEKNYKCAVLIAICSFLLGTKTAILAIFLYFFMIIFHRANKRIKIMIMILFIVCVAAFIYVCFYTDLFSYQIEKMKRLYDLFEGRILSVVLSGRDIDLKNHTQFYDNHFSIKQLLFGYGYRNNVKIIELDFFDTLYSYGLLFCLIITSLYIYPFYQNKNNIELLFFDALILLITFSSGHVWYNTSTALFFVINNVYHRIESGYGTNILHNKYVSRKER